MRAKPKAEVTIKDFINVDIIQQFNKADMSTG